MMTQLRKIFGVFKKKELQNGPYHPQFLITVTSASTLSNKLTVSGCQSFLKRTVTALYFVDRI